MLHKTRNLTCLIFANGVSHFSKRYQISPNWKISNENDPSETEGTGSPSPERDTLSACSPIGKPHPTLSANSGMHFPQTPSTGNCIPFCGPILGHSFRQGPQPETVSHSEGKFRDTLSTCGPTGNRIPFQSQIPGRAFRNPVHPESLSHPGRIGVWNHQPHTLATVASTSAVLESK